MSERADKLGAFLADVSNWRWDEYVEAELDKNNYTSNQAIIFALIRAAAMQKMDAIKVAINRLDGKQATPVRVEYPKIFYLYPNATVLKPTTPTPDALLEGPATTVVENTSQEVELVTGEIMEPMPEDIPDDTVLPSMGFRETLAMMGDYPQSLPDTIIALAQQAEQFMRHPQHNERPIEVPMVKSVVAANLLVMARKRNMDAISEVFDSIDGKLVETIKLVGEDIYITDYSGVAPPDAKRNKDGVLMTQATQVEQSWADKLAKGNRS